MQRINLFPNPVFAGPLTNTSRWGDANGTVRDNALHITGTRGGYGFNVAVPFNVPLLLSMRVDASDDNVAGLMLIQTTDKASVNNMLSSQKLKQGISDVLCRFTVPSHGFRFEVNPYGIRDVAVSNVLIERADTYDAAVGGGSGLLRRADHTVLRRVTADEDQEPLRRSALRADDANMEFQGPGCRHTGRRALEIQLSSKCELDSVENVRLSDDKADACKRMGVHTSGVLGLALLVVRWSAGRGHIQGEAEYRQHPGAARVRGHANRHVLRRVGRVADFAGGWCSYLRRRHRTLLNILGVAA